MVHLGMVQLAPRFVSPVSYQVARAQLRQRPSGGPIWLSSFQEKANEKVWYHSILWTILKNVSKKIFFFLLFLISLCTGTKLCGRSFVFKLQYVLSTKLDCPQLFLNFQLVPGPNWVISNYIFIIFGWVVHFEFQFQLGPFFGYGLVPMTFWVGTQTFGLPHPLHRDIHFSLKFTKINTGILK